MTKSRAQRYADQSVLYVLNAGKAFAEREYEKAGEFLWGGMADALKAHAATNHRQIKRHWDIGDYAIELSKSMPEPDLYNVFFKVQSLHSNFYEADLKPAVVEGILRDATPMIGKILSAAGFQPTI
jgi:hypothetical protein